jgi:hypothetical protein
MVEQTNVLIPWYPISYLTIASSGFWGGGAYGSQPDAAIWWCLWTGGGGVLTRLIRVRNRANQTTDFLMYAHCSIIL